MSTENIGKKEFGRKVESTQKIDSVDNYIKRVKELEKNIDSNPNKRFEILVESLKNPDEYIRREALDLAGKTLSREKRLKVFLIALKDSNYFIRDMVIDIALGWKKLHAETLSDEEKLKIIETVFKDTDYWTIREKALWLGKEALSGEKRLKVFLMACKDEHPRISQDAKNLLMYHYPEEARKRKK